MADLCDCDERRDIYNIKFWTFDISFKGMKGKWLGTSGGNYIYIQTFKMFTIRFLQREWRGSGYEGGEFI